MNVARASQIERGEVTSFEVIARYVKGLGGRPDLDTDFGDRTVQLPVTDPRRPHYSNHVGQPPPRTSRPSRHGCDSAFPRGTTHRQTDHGPCTCRTHITAARDGHPASVATA